MLGPAPAGDNLKIPEKVFILAIKHVFFWKIHQERIDVFCFLGILEGWKHPHAAIQPHLWICCFFGVIKDIHQIIPLVWLCRATIHHQSNHPSNPPRKEGVFKKDYYGGGIMINVSAPPVFVGQISRNL